MLKWWRGETLLGHLPRCTLTTCPWPLQVPPLERRTRGSWDMVALQAVPSAAPVPSCVVSISIPGTCTCSGEQVQLPEHCNRHRWMGIIPFLGCRGLDIAQLPPFSSCGCLSWPVPPAFPPSDIPASSPHFSSSYHLCSFPHVLPPTMCCFGGQGTPSLLRHPRCMLPHYTGLSCSSRLPAKAEKFPSKGSLCCKYILPAKKMGPHELTVKACAVCESHSNITNKKETSWIQCHFCSHLLSPAAHWACYSSFCPPSLTVIFHPWPPHCSCCVPVSTQTLPFKLSLFWSILAFMGLPPRFNSQTVLWDFWVLNCLLLYLLEATVFFVQVDRSIALSCMLNCSLSLKQTIWQHGWHRFILELSSSHGLAVSVTPSLPCLCLHFSSLVVLANQIFSKKIFT